MEVASVGKCDHCDGSGYHGKRKCPVCNGTGKVDPHKKMLAKSKRLAKKMGTGAVGGKKNFDYGGKMFTAEAWKAD